MSLTKNNYYQEKLRQINLSDKTLQSIEFEECHFSDCSFVACKFVGCKFIDCVFSDCKLSAIIPTNSRFINIDFINSKIIGFDWTQVQHIEDLSFVNCQLNYSNFKLLKLPKLTMTNCEAQEVDLTESDLTESNFTGTDFAQTVFSKTNLTKANFHGAKNYSIDARSATITKARFSLPEALTLLGSLDIIIDQPN